MAPTASDFVQEAAQEIGRPYVWGGHSPRGFDCSGLVQYALQALGLSKVPRTSQQQYAWTDRVDAENVQAGDLVFMQFPGETGAGHVAIYAGDRRVIQAPKAGENVQRVPFTPLPAGASEWGGRIIGYGRVPGLAYTSLTLEGLWLHAGGPPKVARTMAAIALAESGGRVDATHTNTDGTTDDGLWQINSSHRYNRRRLRSDPGYNARAAVAVYRSQGLTAWTTYTSGAYKAFLANAATAQPIGRPPRPDAGGASGGGGSSSSSAGADTSAAQESVWSSYLDEGQPGAHAPGFQPVSFWGDVGHLGAAAIDPAFGIPGLGSWNPLSIFHDASSAVSDLGTFLKWVAWLFSPRNILRVVEFVTGAGLMLVGAYFAAQGGRSSSSSGPSGQAKATVRRAVRRTPVGRAAALAGAERSGRRAARHARIAQESASHRDEEKRTRKRAQKRSEARRKPGETRRAARGRRKAEKKEGLPF